MKKQKQGRLLCALCLALLLIPLAGMLLAGPSDAVSNERLAAKPRLMRAGKLNPDFLSETADYFAGHFYLRPALITANSTVQAAVFRESASEDVVLGDGGWLFYADTLEDLCFLLQEVVEGFMSAMFNPLDKGNLYIRRALNCMARDYGSPITLESVAGKVGLSPSYFSALFHRTVGTGFREHLNRIRIEESRRLLLSTDYSLTDIAVAVGFADQSYFCKIFRQIVGITPGRFRSGSADGEAK